ncbi:MAG: ParA family protein [Chloroflexota bacterium]|nr:ParA family protein [Chloroflexota bacterium]
MARILAITNQKGGVGKTTTAINLAACLVERGKRVLLVDTDPQANASSGLGFDKAAIRRSVYDALINGMPLDQVVLLTNRVGLDLAPAADALAGAEVELVSLNRREYRLEQALAPLRSRYDYVLLDCPPSLGLLTVNALVAADGVLVPIQCEYLALEGLSRLINTVRLVRDSLNPRLRLAGIVMTMFDPRTNLSTQVVQDVAKHFPKEIFKTIVPRSIRLSEAPSYGRTILEYDAGSRGAQAYRALAEELVGRG